MVISVSGSVLVASLDSEDKCTPKNLTQGVCKLCFNIEVRERTDPVE